MITTSRALAERVSQRSRAADAGDRARARQSIARHGGIIVCRNVAEAIALANDAASEHVVVGTESLARRVS